MRRSSVLVAVAAVFLLIVPGGAASAGPEVLPPEDVDDTIEFDAGFPCEFAVDVHVTGKEGAILFEDRGILTAPGLAVDIVAENGASRSEKIAGVFHDTYGEEGVRTKATGRNVLFGFFDGEPGMFLTIGKIVSESPYDDFLAIDIIEGESPGRMIDLCAALAG